MTHARVDRRALGSNGDGNREPVRTAEAAAPRASFRRFLRNLLIGDLESLIDVKPERRSVARYYVRKDDWPIHRADYDLTPAQAIAVVKRMGDHYEAAMESLANPSEAAKQIAREEAAEERAGRTDGDS